MVTFFDISASNDTIFGQFLVSEEAKQCSPGPDQKSHVRSQYWPKWKNKSHRSKCHILNSYSYKN